MEQNLLLKETVQPVLSKNTRSISKLCVDVDFVVACVIMGDKQHYIQIICDECDSADHP